MPAMRSQLSKPPDISALRPTVARATHPFDRCGLAARSDLDSPEWAELYSLMEREQAEFLARERDFRSPEYGWPRDALHWWSRIWEYPYVYHQLREQRARFAPDRAPRAIDFGSGVTFFPFAAAKLGYEVMGVDIDPVCTRDLTRAAAAMPHAPGRVAAIQTTRGEIPFPDGSADVVYCVSVLEHVPAFEFVVEEMARVLMRGGILVLTFDIDLRGDFQLGVAERRTLWATLRRHFGPVHAAETIHPVDLMRSWEGRYPIPSLRPHRFVIELIRNRILKPLRGEPCGSVTPFRLAVEGVTLQKR